MTHAQHIPNLIFLATLSSLPCPAIATDLATAAATRVELVSRVTIAPQRIDDLEVKGFSALAWDDDEQILYAVTDKGRIVHMRLSLQDGKLQEITPVRAIRLKDESGQDVKKSLADLEGATVSGASNGKNGDTELLFAREVPPEIIRSTPDGRIVGRPALPEKLRDPAAYEHGSNGLESVIIHPMLGVMTAPEEPLKGSQSGQHVIYSTSGRSLVLPEHPLGTGNIKALEVMPDNRVLIMERMRLANAGGFRTVLRIVDPNDCVAESRCSVQELDIGPEPLPALNFEGLALLPGNLLIVISDDEIDGAARSELLLLRLQTAAQ